MTTYLPTRDLELRRGFKLKMQWSTTTEKDMKESISLFIIEPRSDLQQENEKSECFLITKRHNDPHCMVDLEVAVNRAKFRERDGGGGGTLWKRPSSHPLEFTDASC